MNENPSISSAKRGLRDAARATLRAMDERECADASIAACERVCALPEYRHAKTLMAYLPLPDELDCESLIEHALQAGKTVCVPDADWDSRSMRAARLRSLAADGLVADRHGVRSPRSIEPVAVGALQLIIAPGLAFDERGGRLGRGGGFYDRFLGQLLSSVPIVALAFERQIVPQIPQEPHDASVAMIATETRLIRCD